MNNSEECLICYDNSNTGLVKLECNHNFHVICISRLSIESFKFQNKCCYCFKEFSEKDIIKMKSNLPILMKIKNNIQIEEKDLPEFIKPEYYWKYLFHSILNYDNLSCVDNLSFILKKYKKEYIEDCSFTLILNINICQLIILNKCILKKFYLHSMEDIIFKILYIYDFFIKILFENEKTENIILIYLIIKQNFIILIPKIYISFFIKNCNLNITTKKYFILGSIFNTYYNNTNYNIKMFKKYNQENVYFSILYLLEKENINIKNLLNYNEKIRYCKLTQKTIYDTFKYIYLI